MPLAFFLALTLRGFSQTTANPNLTTNNGDSSKPPTGNSGGSCPIVISDKNYIFKGYLKLTQVTASGSPLDNNLKTQGDVYAEPQTVFKIAGVKSSDCSVIIYYDFNFMQNDKLKIYNYISLDDKDSNGNISELPNNIRFFLISKDEFLTYAEEYTKTSKFEFSFGTFTYPFKFRPQKSYFTSNLSLGSSVAGKYQLNKNNSIGVIIGLSLSSVTLDSASTKGVVKTSTDRPALTPSIGAVYAYKNINFTLGWGWDFINRPSPVERSWIYHGKNWIGFGIGINLFNTASPNTSTEKSNDQSESKTSKPKIAP